MRRGKQEQNKGEKLVNRNAAGDKDVGLDSEFVDQDAVGNKQQSWIASLSTEMQLETNREAG